MVCHIAWGNIGVSHEEKKKAMRTKALLPPFSCLIVHTRTALYASVNPERPRLNWTIVQLNCDLEETLPVNTPPHYFPHSFLVLFPLSLVHTHTHTQALVIHKHKWTRCAALQSQEAKNPGIIAGMISSQRANEEMVKLSGHEGIKEADAITRPSWLFIDSSLHDPCPTIVSWCDAGAVSDRKAYCTFLTNSQWRAGSRQILLSD